MTTAEYNLEIRKKEFEARRIDIESLISMVQFRVSEIARTDPEYSWGTIGDLGRIREDLIDTLDGFAEQGRGDIEQTLAIYRNRKG